MRVRPWARVARIPTTDGDVYFKAPMPALAHEGRVTEVLIQRRPDCLPELVAVESARGWMLIRDAGTQLSAVLERDLDLRYWYEALPLYAELQIGAARDRELLLAAGALDRRAAVLPAQYDELLADEDALRVGLPDGLTRDDHERLCGRSADVSAACAELAAHRVPETIQNDDFSDGSVFVRDGAYRFLDWGDACVSHPFMTLTVTLRVIAYRFSLASAASELARVRDAYLEPWTAFEPRTTLVRLAETARRFGQVCRALLWHRILAEFEPAEREAERETLVWSLRLFLDPDAWREAT